MTYVKVFFLAFVLCLAAHTADAKTNHHHHYHHRHHHGGGGGGNTSWYQSGYKTASGARFDPGGNTVAHRKLPFGTRVLFYNPATGRSACGVVRDRGPFVGGRTWDVSRGIAAKLGMIHAGVANLRVKVGGC